jgi:hypothetical protein
MEVPVAITPTYYAELLDGLAELVPFVRRPSANAMALLWASIPQQVGDELTTHLALFRYLYRLENGLPNFRWGLRQDLTIRMAVEGFHPLPASEADLIAQHGLTNRDGARQEPFGVLDHLSVLPSMAAEQLNGNSNGNGVQAQ